MNTCFASRHLKDKARNLSLLFGASFLALISIACINIQSTSAHAPVPHKPPSRQGKTVTPPPPPPLKRQNIPISRFGAVGNGQTDNTAALKAAIAAAKAAGGANLTAAAGNYCFSAPLVFTNGITLTGASQQNTVFTPTVNGAALIFEGTSGLYDCWIGSQPDWTSVYTAFAQDPTPEQRSIYAAPGANFTLSSVNFPFSIVCIDCNSINMQNCTGFCNLTMYGCHNISMKNVGIGTWLNGVGGTCVMSQDAAQNPNVGVNITSCVFQSFYLDVGGRIASGATQGIQGCAFGNNPVTIMIDNDNSTSETNFNFAKNTLSGDSTTLECINHNPKVNAYIENNQLHTTAPQGLYCAAILGCYAESQTVFGKLVFSSNDVWAPVLCAEVVGQYAGGLTITDNTFSQTGSILWSDYLPEWVGPLNISNNSFSISGASASYFTASSCPILVEIPAPSVPNIASTVTIQNNTCTSSVAIPGYILVLAPSSYKTQISGNKISPTGAITTVVNTVAAFTTLWHQLYGAGAQPNH